MTTSTINKNTETFFKVIRSVQPHDCDYVATHTVKKMDDNISVVNKRLQILFLTVLIPSVFSNVGYIPYGGSLHENMVDIKTRFNTKWWELLDVRKKLLAQKDKLNLQVSQLKKDAFDIPDAHKRIADAVRKNNDKDKARAERRLETALAQEKAILEIDNNVKELTDELTLNLDVINSLVRKEHVSRGLDTLFDSQLVDSEQLSVNLFSYLRDFLMMYPEKIDKVIQWVD